MKKKTINHIRVSLVVVQHPQEGGTAQKIGAFKQKTADELRSRSGSNQKAVGRRAILH